MIKRCLLGNSKKILVFGLAVMLSFHLGTNYSDVNAADINNSTDVEDGKTNEDSGVYAYKMDDFHSTYCIINFDEQCVFLFTDDAENDSCYKMDITSGSQTDSLNAVLATEDISIPISIQFKDNEKKHITLVMQEAFDNELESTDLEEALKVMAEKTIEESATVHNEVESISEVMSEEGQIRHRNRIMGDENRINAVIEDIEFATGETISFEYADFIKESLDIYTDSSQTLKHYHKKRGLPVLTNVIKLTSHSDSPHLSLIFSINNSKLRCHR